MVNISEKIRKIYVNTGNILNLNELKKRVGQSSSEELIESLKIVLKGWAPTGHEEGTLLEIKSNDESIKVAGVEQSELQASVKIFLTSGMKKEALQEALDKLFLSIEADKIDSVVLARSGATQDNKGCLLELQQLWQVLENNINNGKLGRIGISDVDTDLFISLYNLASVKPSIVQINLASCCVVPPALQEFCRQHEIQLLTHNDSLELLPNQVLESIFKEECLSPQLDWAVRFQVHIKCRGVLATKGYITCISVNRI